MFTLTRDTLNIDSGKVVEGSVTLAKTVNMTTKFSYEKCSRLCFVTCKTYVSYFIYPMTALDHGSGKSTLLCEECCQLLTVCYFQLLGPILALYIRVIETNPVFTERKYIFENVFSLRMDDGILTLSPGVPYSKCVWG